MPALVERENITPEMMEKLRRHIVKERERRKQEEKEAEKDFERRAKIEEERRRKEEEDSFTLEQIKDQLTTFHSKLDSLKDEKHQLFLRLKKVLTEEDKKKQKLKEQSDMNAPSHGHFQHPLTNMSVHHILPQVGRYQPHHQIPVPYLSGHSSSSLQGQPSPHLHPGLRHSINQQIPPQPSTSPMTAGVKRPRIPTSPQPGLVQMYQRSNVLAGHAHTPQHDKYEFSHFSPLSGLTNVSNDQATPTRQHLGSLHGSSSPSGRPSSQGSPFSIPLGKQLEHASQQSGFADDLKNSMTPPRGRQPIRMLSQGQLLSQQSPMNQLSQTTRVRSTSPGNFRMNPEKAHSPFHTTSAAAAPIHTFHQIPGSRYYNK